MAWLARGDRVVASLEIARARPERRRGLLGRSDVEGALLIEQCRWVHTVGMRFEIDVAYLDAHRCVIDIVTMPRGRVGLPRWSARSVIEARSGAFERWGVAVGNVLDVRLDA
ncbi:DUF192 domain-containing protein [Candidatus Poriferisodalis sp.]|uniref:DUF192 domain-containing protein n=1 Tax=Candidatus Poriferisodalis sp. TaxID=3101277 RepID=UPI003B025923